MNQDEALQQWGDELRQTGLYVSPILRATFRDGWNRRKAAEQARSDAVTSTSWIDVKVAVPDDVREVMVFLNGHCKLTDIEARKGGGWGHRLGFYDDDKGFFRVQGCAEHFVTHWQDLPATPASAMKG